MINEVDFLNIYTAPYSAVNGDRVPSGRTLRWLSALTILKACIITSHIILLPSRYQAPFSKDNADKREIKKDAKYGF